VVKRTNPSFQLKTSPPFDYRTDHSYDLHPTVSDLNLFKAVYNIVIKIIIEMMAEENP
jgi:hypothetical protein